MRITTILLGYSIFHLVASHSSSTKDISRRQISELLDQYGSESQLIRRAPVKKGGAAKSPRGGAQASLLSNEHGPSAGSSKPSGSQKTYAKVTSKSGPNVGSFAFTAEGRGKPNVHKDVPVGKSKVLTASDPRKSRVGGHPYAGGSTETELSAKHVKVKMNVMPGGLGTVSQKNPKTGAWSNPEMIEHQAGPYKKKFKNDDGSRVDVKATLLGGTNGGWISGSAKDYDKKEKTWLG